MLLKFQLSLTRFFKWLFVQILCKQSAIIISIGLVRETKDCNYRNTSFLTKHELSFSFNYPGTCDKKHDKHALTSGKMGGLCQPYRACLLHSLRGRVAESFSLQLFF